MNWVAGRQGTGYRKLCIFNGKNWDLYLIDYPPGSFIPTHTDPVAGREHWRINFRLCGEDSFQGKAFFRLGPIILFRSDLPHAVSLVTKRRLILSFGITFLKRD